MALSRGVLSEVQFSRFVVTRARRERPDVRVEPVGRSFLMVEAEPGRQRVISLAGLYQTYCESPRERDEVVEYFLSEAVFTDPGLVRGTFAENAERILPQVVPPGLVEVRRRDHQELVALDFVSGLSIAFVLDEPERYTFVHRAQAERWSVTDLELMRTAMTNMQEVGGLTETCHRIGQGSRLMLVWETFDGYDASRVLLSRELSILSAEVSGTPIIAIPHRDYLVMFGDTDEEFVAEMVERIRADHEEHAYPISCRLFTLKNGLVVPYEPGRRYRMVN